MIRRMVAAAALAALAAAAAQAQTIRVATFVPEQSTGVSKVIKPWMEATAPDLPDGVSMQGFWGGTLGKDPFKQFELVRNGVADVTWVLPGYTAGQFPQMSVFELPFLFEDATEASLVGWRLHERGLLDGLEDVHLVGFFASEPNTIFFSEPVENLDALEGKKMRSVGEVHAQWLSEMGAAPQTLSSAEMNEALVRGAIDGVIQGYTGMKTFNTLPLVTQAYEAPIGVIPFLLVMNGDAWEGLPAEAQDAIMRHGGEEIAKLGGAGYSEAGQAIRDEVSAGDAVAIVTPDEATLAEYREQAQPVYDWWIANTPNGQAVWDAVQEELAAIRGS